MKNPSISVVMPVFNGEKYLREAIESVLNQTFDDFEFIIVNDGSTDSSDYIISGYSDFRINYIRQDNTGIGGALRNGCSNAKGTYIARMDADDICLSTRLEQQKSFLDNNPAIVLVSNAVFYIDEFGKSIGRSFPYTSDSAIKKKFKFGSPICHPSVMMRKSAYIASGGYHNLEPIEDLCLWIELSKIGKLQNLSTPLLKYRILNSSISRSISSEQYKLIIQYLISNVNSVDNSIIHELNGMYRNAKNEAKDKYEFTDKSETFMPNSKLELYLYTKFKSLKLPDSLIELVICNVKNAITYF